MLRVGFWRLAWGPRDSCWFRSLGGAIGVIHTGGFGGSEPLGVQLASRADELNLQGIGCSEEGGEARSAFTAAVESDLAVLPQMDKEAVADWVVSNLEKVGKTLGLTSGGQVAESNKVLRATEEVDKECRGRSKVKQNNGRRGVSAMEQRRLHCSITYERPTLHKPSIMAHVVRVLKGEKTLRMHYANCSTYNADFDGDEMNVHFPQDEISRAEAVNIVNANNQYIVPTSGDPIRGLIQDHIVGAVLLTKKDTFLTRDEYNQLLYSSGVSAAESGSFLGRSGQKISAINSEDEMQPLLPAIWKPEPLWTGKQVITALLNHITRGRTPFTVTKAGRIPSDYFGNESGEVELLIQKNEFVHGVIDKAQFGKYGLVHTVQELYGSNTAGILLSVLSRLFTVFLQMHGFTCGVDDLLIVRHYDMERKRKLENSEKIGEHVHSQFIGSKDGAIDPKKLQMEIEKAIRRNGEPAVTRLDRMMSNALNGLTSEINNELLPKGLLKSFPRNCLSLMTTTGAKGGLVNFTQISSLLGQQELEGKRVPRMVSGKTLPCFPPWDCASRAGGFVSDRFLTGLRPQEYYFHCMAGREGLVDTAVKTSRSGYLQRCLIKNLECLKVCYDQTVRDADGSVVQFCYGEDSVDVHKTSFLAKFEALAANQGIVQETLSGQLDNAHLFKTNSYIKELPAALEEGAKDFIRSLSKKERDSFHLRNRKDFMNLMKLKYLSSLAQPGEPVGVIAAQSVGEPSTQMTLNTFHFAGRGEMNVTLGIPRLQEILMRASDKIQTPVMSCPLQKEKTRDHAERLAAKLKKVTVADVIESMEVCVVPFSVRKHQISTIYKLKMKLYRPEIFPPYSGISLEDCEETLEVRFVRELEDSIQNHLIMLSKISGIKNIIQSAESGASKETDEDDPGKYSQQMGGKGNDDDDGGGDIDNDDEGDEDLGMDAQKRKRQATDEMDYEDGAESEIDVPENEHDEGDPSAGFESEIDQVEVEDDISMDREIQIFDAEDEASETQSRLEPISKSSEKKTKTETKEKKKARARRVKKDTDRAVFVEARGLEFEVHFRLTNEPHILLAQIAQKASKNVYIKKSGKIERCSVIEDNENPGTPVLQTAGVDFRAFWNMQDELDINNIRSNDIHAMLKTYGVEAARGTIINEVKRVFGLYGISVNIRHLTLIADFMTHSGGYRPMSRYGIADSTSPFSKMSFETASRFIVEAAYHGEIDNLESPSARICLGLPVKMGTGCFDLMQKLLRMNELMATTDIIVDDLGACAWQPKCGMEFDSEQDAYDFYNAYGGRVEFGIRRDTYNKNKSTGEMTSRIFVCSVEGFRGSQTSSNETFLIQTLTPTQMTPKNRFHRFFPLLLLLSLSALFLYSHYHSSLHLFASNTFNPNGSPTHLSLSSFNLLPNPNSISPNFTLTLKVLAFDRLDSLSRCLRSLANADYGNDRVNLHVFVDHFKELDSRTGSGILDKKLEESHQILDFVDGFMWRFGEKFTHYRTGNVGLQAQWLEAWWPSSDDEFAFVVEDDLELSPLYYKFLRGLIVHYYYNSSNFSPSIYGVSLQRPRFVAAGWHLGSASLSETLERVPSVFGRPDTGSCLFSFELSLSEKPGKVTTGWYKKMGERIWTPWFIKYIHSRGYFNIYTNFQHERALSVSHRDAGVNYGKTAGPDSYLLNEKSLDFDLLQMQPLSNLKWYDFCFREVLPGRVVSSFDELVFVLYSPQKQKTTILVSLFRVSQTVTRNLLCQFERLDIQNYILVGPQSDFLLDLARRGHLVVNADKLLNSIRGYKLMGFQGSDVELVKEILVKAYIIKKCLESRHNSWVIDGNVLPVSSDAFSDVSDPSDLYAAKDLEFLFVRSSAALSEIWVDGFISKVAAMANSLLGRESLSRDCMNFGCLAAKSLEQKGVRIKMVDELSFGVKIGIDFANQTSLGDGKKIIFWSSDMGLDLTQRRLQDLGMWMVDGDSSCTAVVCHQS
ncbi:hypothetical protein HHK36_019697 [Tetracentron sinense]|uniref:DNA-directed RNA polymerase I subunit RPA1 n=1 Tax=Tetracentron sinense TaxID=13715 RepID=A0A835DA99_TETSI|nr:hypothetical protein HHK36_019697 [Tetracentron sinense]